MSAPLPLRLGVNIDHVATIRNARGGDHPDPVRAAEIVASVGGDGITAHLREDRRHIRDDDLKRIMAATTLPLNLEMAATEEMLEIALRHKPHAACIVPEKREERTTEGGLNVTGGHNHLAPFVRALQDANLDLLSAGTAEQRVFEHLATEHMSRLLAEAGATYDLILVDVAPAVVAGDAAALANRVDASILVVRALSEKRGLVARLRSTLTDARAQFFGVVVNGVRSSAGGYFKHNIKATHAYHDRS